MKYFLCEKLLIFSQTVVSYFVIKRNVHQYFKSGLTLDWFDANLARFKFRYG